MTIQIWEAKNFDSQKAVRFFKERNIAIQRIDLLKYGISRRELESVRARVGLEALIDRESGAFRSSTVRFSDREELIFQALLDNPKLIRAPVVRGGKAATVGYMPEVWKEWV